MSISYKDSGVDIEAGENIVNWLVSEDKSKKRSSNIISGIGGFASIYKLPLGKYKSPCLVSATDGVGTKLKLAFQFQEYESIAQDLVAMCLNDLVTVGAEPLYFLDYFSTGQLEEKITQSFLKGVRQACEACGCDLIGGETAEMPGFYPKGEFDCAGFAVGVVEESKILSKDKVTEGDRVIGWKSSGFHSNGYSLVRKVFENDLEVWKEPLLAPTRLYVKPALEAMRFDVHSMSHITGGGLDNISRVIPDGLSLKLQNWQWPELFLKTQEKAQISKEQMLKTFNCGVGFALIVGETSFKDIWELSEKNNMGPVDLGTIERGGEKLHLPL